MEVFYFYLKPATLLNVMLLHGCSSLFLIVQMVPNYAKHHIRVYMYKVGQKKLERHWVCKFRRGKIEHKRCNCKLKCFPGFHHNCFKTFLPSLYTVYRVVINLKECLYSKT